MVTQTDLMPQLQDFAAQHKKLPPHEAARQFVIVEGKARGGVEVMVVVDKNGAFAGAGTSHNPAFVNFPPSVSARLDDPTANLVVHHNHPPGSETALSAYDLGGLADKRGIGWLLLHKDEGTAAVRAKDWLFQPRAEGGAAIEGLTAAFKSGTSIAQFEIFKRNIDIGQDDGEDVAKDMALRALQKVGAVDYHSSFKREISLDAGNAIIDAIISQSRASPERGGDAIWRGPESGAVPAAPGGSAGTARAHALSDPSAVEAQFNFFLDLLSRTNPAAPDAANAGRPQSADPAQTGGNNSGLARNDRAGRPVLASRLKL